MSDVFVNHWVVVKVQGNSFAIFPTDVVIRCVLPPLVEGGVMMTAEYLIVEPQTEARTTESVGPDFGIFAMAADLGVVPLFRQVGCNTRMAPSEGVVAIANHAEWFVPLIVV
jgi:hypothetical protein